MLPHNSPILFVIKITMSHCKRNIPMDESKYEIIQIIRMLSPLFDLIVGTPSIRMYSYQVYPYEPMRLAEFSESANITQRMEQPIQQLSLLLG